MNNEPNRIRKHNVPCAVQEEEGNTVKWLWKIQAKPVHRNKQSAGVIVYPPMSINYQYQTYIIMPARRTSKSEEFIWLPRWHYSINIRDAGYGHVITMPVELALCSACCSPFSSCMVGGPGAWGRVLIGCVKRLVERVRYRSLWEQAGKRGGVLVQVSWWERRYGLTKNKESVCACEKQEKYMWRREEDGERERALHGCWERERQILKQHSY